MTTATVLSIGNEVISGRILDTNVQWLSQRLEELGIRVLHHAAVGDDLELLTAAFREAIAGCDVLLATGGLGPTADDLTREALAAAVGRSLVCNDEALTHIKQLFARRGRTMAPRNELQAYFPEGARVVHNPNGTAPGIELDAPRPATAGICRVVVLPGVPAEMIEMWHDSVAARLAAVRVGGRMIRHTQVNCFGAGESQIEAMLPDGFLRQTDPVVGINASQTTIIFRIAAEGADEAECRRKAEPVVATIRQRLGNLVFGEGDEQLQQVVLRLLHERQQTLAVAEWGTAGLIADWLGAVADHRTAFAGGVVAGNGPMLAAALDLPADALGDPPGLGRDAAAAMAAACRQRFATSYGLAVSRFPEPVAASQTPGVFFLALAGPGGVQTRERPLAGHPAFLRTWCAKQALNLLRLALLE